MYHVYKTDKLTPIYIYIIYTHGERSSGIKRVFFSIFFSFYFNTYVYILLLCTTVIFYNALSIDVYRGRQKKKKKGKVTLHCL